MSVVCGQQQQERSDAICWTCPCRRAVYCFLPRFATFTVFATFIVRIWAMLPQLFSGCGPIPRVCTTCKSHQAQLGLCILKASAASDIAWGRRLMGCGQSLLFFESFLPCLPAFFLSRFFLWRDSCLLEGFRCSVAPSACDAPSGGSSELTSESGSCQSWVWKTHCCTRMVNDAML